MQTNYFLGIDIGKGYADFIILDKNFELIDVTPHILYFNLLMLFLNKPYTECYDEQIPFH